MNTPNYSEYTVTVTSDPSYYGDECTVDDGIAIADKLQRMISRKYPGIGFNRTRDLGEPSYTTGPDSEVIDEINGWISDNWTAAL